MHELVSLLEKVESPGTFSVSGQFPSILPGLKVKGLGLISLPLPESQAKEIIKISEQAPFGRGEETIIDTKVRNVWQISPEQYEITNPQWEESLQEILNEKIGKQLGLQGCKIESEPYKLLIYEKESFFIPHRDTEKIPNMFATLVINLPSEHKGGELIVSHGGHSQHYSFDNKDLFHPHFIAFYADCYHEVKPIASGYRICLIYNLAIANRKKQPLLSNQLNNIENINQFLKEWTKKKKDNPIICYLLDHGYSEKNLSLSNLKNGDFARAKVLLSSAEQNDCQAFLCLVTYCRTSYGDTKYYGRYYYKDDDDLGEDDFEEYGVESEEIYAHSFMTSKGDYVGVKKIRLDEDEILAETSLFDGPGRDFSISEATGNEGATKELWYQRGAIIIWPKDRIFDTVAKMDIDYGIHYLKQCIMEHDLLKGDRRQKIIQLADYIIDNQLLYGSDDISQDLIAIGDIQLLKKYVRKQLSQSYSLNNVDTQTFLQIVETFGWEHFKDDVSSELANKKQVLPWINTLLLENRSLSREGKSVIKDWFETFWKPSLERSLTTNEIANVLQVISVLKIHKLTDPILDFLSEQKQPLFLIDAYGPAVVNTLKILNECDFDRTILRQFVENVRQQIRIDYPSPPDKPKDWFREGSLNCNCEFCAQVNQFLPDPVQREICFFKTLKRNMTHVQSEIEKSQVDLDIDIIKTPPKFKGICRKNQNKYNNKLKLFNRSQKIVKQLQLKKGK